MNKKIYVEDELIFKNLAGNQFHKITRNKLLIGNDVTFLVHPWDDRDKYNSDYYYLAKKYQKILQEVISHLNKIHSTSYDSRYWEIYVGPWLRFFIDYIYEKYLLCMELKSKGVIFCSYDNKEYCVPNNFNEFYSGVSNNYATNKVLSTISKFLNIEILYLNINPESSVKNKSSLIKRVINNFFSTLYRLPIKKSVVIVGAYCSTWLIIKLYLRLKQVPFFNYEVDFSNNTKINYKLRDEGLKITIEDAFDELLNILLIKFIPTSYIENFNFYRKISSRIFPPNPKIIFTANYYQSYDLFKLYVAESVQKSCKFYIAQHGGNMGIALHNQPEEHQISVSEKFITWGWGNNPKTVNLPSLLLSSKNKNKNKNKNIYDIVFILGTYPKTFYCHYSVPVGYQYIDHLKDVIEIINSISKSYSILIKLPNDDYSWNLEAYLTDNINREYVIEKGKFQTAINSARVCLSTYNSTTFLQSVSSGVPSIWYLEKKYYETRSQFNEIKNSLMKSKVLFDSKQDLILNLNNILSNLDKWWNNPNLQFDVNSFCQNYCLKNDQAVQVWSDFFEKNI